MLYFYPPSSITAPGAEVVVSVSKIIVNMTNTQYTTLQGLVANYAQQRGVYAAGVNHAQFLDLDLSNHGQSGIVRSLPQYPRSHCACGCGC